MWEFLPRSEAGGQPASPRALGGLGVGEQRGQAQRGQRALTPHGRPAL